MLFIIGKIHKKESGFYILETTKDEGKEYLPFSYTEFDLEEGDTVCAQFNIKPNKPKIYEAVKVLSVDAKDTNVYTEHGYIKDSNIYTYEGILIPFYLKDQQMPKDGPYFIIGMFSCIYEKNGKKGYYPCIEIERLIPV